MSKFDFSAHRRKIVPFPVLGFNNLGPRTVGMNARPNVVIEKSHVRHPKVPYCGFSILESQVFHTDTRKDTKLTKNAFLLESDNY